VAPQPQAEAPRLPRVEDFPPMVQAEIDAPSHQGHDEDRGPFGLLKRLTNGLSRREEEPARLQPAAQPREPRLRQAPPEARRAAEPDQLYAPRGQLDDQGRVAVQRRAVDEEDQLDIPAFLRRQAN
jgi:cell division protein FtsZ